MLTTNFSVKLLTGETLKVAGPGTVEFAAPEVVGAGHAAFTQGAAGAGNTMAANGMAANSMVGGGTTATITKTAATSGTIWSGKGLSLGLGLGLGAWGPVLLASAVGGYIYWRKQQGLSALPFKIAST